MIFKREMLDGGYYPSEIVVFCDTCGLEDGGDFIVHEDEPKPSRLGRARAYLSDHRGWRCDESGDFCPAHLPAPAEPAAPAHDTESDDVKEP